VACVLMVAGITAWVSRSPIFAMRSLAVTGNVHESDREVARMAGVSRDTNLVWMSTGSVRDRLLHDPWILSATVSRSLPSSIAIVVAERTAIAVVRAGDGSYLVSADGVVLERVQRPGAAGLPGISVSPALRLSAGQRIAASTPALVLAARLPVDVRAQVARVSAGPGGVELETRAGVRVLYGDASNAAVKALALQAVLRWAAANHVDPVYVDVSVPATPALMPRGAASELPLQGSTRPAGTSGRQGSAPRTGRTTHRSPPSPHPLESPQ
jgi:cell division protein FtsQ